MMNEPTANGYTPRKGLLPDPIVVSRPGAVLYTEIYPLEGELRDALTTNINWIGLPREDESPRRRWWERLAYAWRGL